MEVVKSVKTNPPEVMSLVLPSFRVVRGRHRRKALLAAQCLEGTFFPSFKSHYSQGSWSGALPFPCAGVLVAFLFA
jgi:hypothetical protein